MHLKRFPSNIAGVWPRYLLHSNIGDDAMYALYRGSFLFLRGKLARVYKYKREVHDFHSLVYIFDSFYT